MDEQIRQVFQNRIQKGLHGPGSDTWGLPDSEEILSDYPLIRYFTGIVFPDKSICKNEDEADSANMRNVSEDNEDDENLIIEKDENPETTSKAKEIDEDKLNHNSFFPTNIGISICLPQNINELQCTFSFGVYHQVTSPKEVKIKINRAGYDSFFEEQIPYQLPFKDALKYDGEYMYLERALKGYKGGKNKRSEEYVAFDEFRKSGNLKDSSAKYYITFLEKLIGRAWQRTEIIKEISVPAISTKQPVPIEFESVSKHPNAAYNVKVIEKDSFKYVKVQLVNVSELQASNRFNNKNEVLNAKCLFQAKIEVHSEYLSAFNEGQLSTFDMNSEYADVEAIELDFLYRNVKKYAVGHNCSAVWDETNPNIAETTFLPEQNIKDTINSFDSDNPKLNQALDIRNMSVWGLKKETVIENLNYFVKDYNTWVNKQVESNSTSDSKDKEIGQRIIDRQKANLERLYKNIELLKDDDTFNVFQLANTAMLIQLIVSNDKDFGREEKELSDAKTENLDSLAFFENYNAEQRKSEGKIKFIPAYRPFQLAFLLLSIEGIIKPDSSERNDVVDLIWFPTGGGKTEAYLAVAAFTMINRRISNLENYYGTSVIMRYTLRLLTAQQFERASRLISALEFMRKHKVSPNIGDKSFSIGLWVGQASTPNDLKDVAVKIKIIDDECKKRHRGNELNGRPDEKNVFQISSCPWCGTKLITKSKTPSGKEIWIHGFKHRPNQEFKLFCVNKNCSFHSEIPVQVVDELLYQEPPTLLFGTVDKFAMLAWRENAHRFFNSLDDKGLPPDLIIQDELHLLSGPLGSITGLYESMIELLSTKGKQKPKIIASTATTRNTGKQIECLYGNRTVNIFPPTGLTYNDSYFARESTKASKRRYLGIMPTGKTSVDTQLHIIAHLLVARIIALREFEQKQKMNINNYWTIVSYYNSLKDVGRTFNKIVDDISPKVSALQNLLSTLLSPLNGSHIQNYNFNYRGLSSRTKELTSRIESAKIKATLKELENEFSQDKIEQYEKGGNYLQDVVDLVLATNMISVGIDIGRLNIMLINGIPKNIAEYIQASSRVGRSTHGLVVTHFDPNRAREKSYFEHFKGFHQAFYKSVEPLSVTPFTENTIEKMIASIIVTYVRNKVPGMAQNINAKYFQKEMTDGLKTFVKQRFSSIGHELHVFERTVDEHSWDWIERIKNNSEIKYEELLQRPSSGGGNWEIMQSMREIDTSTWLQIKETF